MNASPKRRWFQFSLKAMLLVMTLACVALGWLAYERNEVRKRAEVIAAIEKLGGHMTFGQAHSFRPNWPRLLLGGKSDGEVTGIILPPPEVTDAGLDLFKDLRELKTLNIFDTKVTDAGLVHLKGLKELEWLLLDGTQVTDSGLVHLAGLTNLETLWLQNTRVTDSGLVHFKGLAKLVFLALKGTQVTDAGLVHLRSLTKLEMIWLGNTQVTDQGVRELERALPSLTIVR